MTSVNCLSFKTPLLATPVNENKTPKSIIPIKWRIITALKFVLYFILIVYSRALSAFLNNGIHFFFR